MRHVRMLMLVLTVGLVFAAVAGISSASAEKLPAWGKCEALPGNTGGKYADAGCTLPVKKVNHAYPGGYEWYPLQRTEEEIENYQSSRLSYAIEAVREGVEQPVSETMITFPSGRQIKCGAALEETSVRLGGAHVTTEAPNLIFGECTDEQGEECHTTDSEAAGLMQTVTAYEDGLFHEPGSWTGTASFIEGRDSTNPVVGIVYKTEEKRGQRFLQQLICNAHQPGTEPLSITIGGHKSGEELVTQLAPVNTMSRSFTASLRQSDGVQLPAALEGHPTKPWQAQVNLGEWETVGLETTILFPEVAPSIDQRNHDQLSLELKATP